jgi:hypothetical protein
MNDNDNIICEYNGNKFIIKDKKTKAELRIDINGSWTFVAPHLPELADDYSGSNILTFFSGVL